MNYTFKKIDIEKEVQAKTVSDKCYNLRLSILSSLTETDEDKLIFKKIRNKLSSFLDSQNVSTLISIHDCRKIRNKK